MNNGGVALRAMLLWVCRSELEMKHNEHRLINRKVVIAMAVGIVGRLIPHVPNVTPLLGLSLFSGANLPRWSAFLTVILTLVVSDVALAFMYGYPIFSFWTLFTYSGFIAVMAIGSRFRKVLSRWSGLLYVFSASLGFWLWTNFGVWLIGGLYPKTFAGLGFCYVAALPFLRNAMIGDIIWSAVFFGLFALGRRRFAHGKFYL